MLHLHGRHTGQGWPYEGVIPMSNQPISTFLGVAAAVVLAANSDATTRHVSTCGNDDDSGEVDE